MSNTNWDRIVIGKECKMTEAEAERRKAWHDGYAAGQRAMKKTIGAELVKLLGLDDIFERIQEAD